MRTIRLRVENLDKEQLAEFEMALKKISGSAQIKSWWGKVEITIEDSNKLNEILSYLNQAGFNVAMSRDAQPINQPVSQNTKDETVQNNEPVKQSKSYVSHKVKIDGMTCRSCEINVERRFKKLKGVQMVDVDASSGTAKIVCEDGCVPSLDDLRQSVEKDGYKVRKFIEDIEPTDNHGRPSFLKLLGLFAVVFIVGSLLSKLGLFNQGYSIGNSVSFFAAMLIGLVAGVSSCIAVSGGLMLSSAAKYREKYGNINASARMRPIFMFVIGRIVSYGVLGGLIGVIGKALTPSPLVTGLITIAAAFFMLIIGLDILKLAPAWLKNLLPKVPKSLSHRIMDAEGKNHPMMPFFLGAGTFFIPCGFTQALQLYALTTGSFWAGAFALAGFAIGTAPALLALGWVSSSLKGKIGKLFYQFSGALIIVLGLINIQSGFTVAGYPIGWPSFAGITVNAADKQPDKGPLLNAKGEQVIRMTVDGEYSPDNFTVKAGVPVRWEINGADVRGCISVLQSPKLGVRMRLLPGLNVANFTAPSAGRYVFSCSMGMFRGTINAI